MARLMGVLTVLCIGEAAVPAFAQGCIGCVPLNDLGAGSYQGAQGGLYPGGTNVVPAGHAAAALRAAYSVVPRSASGAPHPDGLVGIASVGVSNFGQEWRELTRRVEADPGYGGHLVLVDGAINGGVTALLVDPLAAAWQVLDDRIHVAGLTREQVQVVFVETSSVEIPALPFPMNAQTLRDELGDVVRILHARFPHLRLVFLDSLIYAGHSTSFLTEPRSYEEGFAVKWLIEDQIAGDPGLEHDPRRGPVVAPVILWGPYLWANGATPRSDGLVWLPPDFESDGFHPSALGEAKVADLFEDFIVDSRAARAIFRPRSGVTRGSQPIVKDAGLDAAQPGTALGAGMAVDVVLPDRTGLVESSVAPYSGRILHAKLALEPDGRAGQVLATGVSDTSWNEATVTAASAPAFDGISSVPLALTSNGMLAEWDVTAWVTSAAPSAGGAVAFGLSKTAPTLLSSFFARESGRPGWLAVSIDREPGGVEPFCASLPTSSGEPALLSSIGTASLGASDLLFSLTDLPASTAALPLVGTTSAELALPGGDVCVGGALTRLPLVVTNQFGRATFDVDWGAPGTNVLPGDTRTVQVVFRDVVPEGYRTTSALVVTFRP